MSRVLAIDFGSTRLGLALSDETRTIAGGAGTMPNDAGCLQQLADLVRDRGVTAVVVGLPLLLSGAEGSSAKAARDFVERLRAAVDAPVSMLDERFTSLLAERTIRELGVGRKQRRRKEKIDEIAAVILLQGYLDMQR